MEPDQISDTPSTMRILCPAPGVYAYYDGRIAGRRLHSPARNWLDDGAYGLGSACYAIVDGTDALIYDTHMSLAHAGVVRDHVSGVGATSIRVVLSHWHADHVAGNAVFADCEIIALTLTAEALVANRTALAAGDPPIDPLVMPNRLFDQRLDLMVGRRRVELHHFAIHSADGNVLWLPDDGLLLAGDTLEDTITYITEPDHVATHTAELTRMSLWPIRRILPNHGDPARITAGGYTAGLIGANRRYLEQLAADIADGAPVADLHAFIAEDGTAGNIAMFQPYEAVHRQNIMVMTAAYDRR